MRCHSAIFVFVTLNVFALPVQAIDADFANGERLLLHHHVRESIECFNRAITRNPKFAEAYVRRGKAYCELEKRDAALRDLDTAIKLDPNHWHDFDVRARIKYELADIDGAIADATRSIELAPKEDSMYRFRAKMYSVQKKWDEALSDLNRAVELAPNNGSNYKLRADVYFRNKKYDQAINDYTRGIELVRRVDSGGDELQRYLSARANAYDKCGKKALADADRKKCQEFVKDGWGAFLYESKD